MEVVAQPDKATAAMAVTVNRVFFMVIFLND
jgi:hypothetical protein